MSEKNKNEEDFIYNVNMAVPGFYRWRYDLNLLKDPSVFFMVWRIFFFIYLGVFAVTNIVDFIRFDDFYPERLLYNLRFLGYTFIGMNVLIILGYLIYALIMRGKYCMEFAMDEKGILNIQISSQAKDSCVVSGHTFMIALEKGSLTAVGIAINSARSEMYSDFSKVTSVKAYKKRNLIKVNSKLSHNRIYCKQEDLDFVLDYITSNCKNLK